MQPWRDRSGHVSVLKLAVFLALFLPAGWTLLGYEAGALGARPLTEAIHQTGLWTIRLLMLSLAVTPLRRVLNWPRLIQVRRMIGVAAFAYGMAHLALYAADQAFAWRVVVSEIALRLYLTIGFATLVLLAALAATSTDGMMRRLGGRAWRRLHRLAYAAGLLALVHYFMQSKLDIAEPLMMAGLFGWLMAFRAIGRLDGERWPVWSLALISLVSAAATALGEAAYIRIAYGADPLKVLAANLAGTVGSRSSWAVFLIGLAITIAGAWRAGRAGRSGRRTAPGAPLYIRAPGQ